MTRRKFVKIFMTTTRIIVAIISIVLGAYTQLLILHPSTHYVYIGETVVVFGLCAAIYYNAFMNVLKYFLLED